MTKREAKREAYGLAAALLVSDMDEWRGEEADMSREDGEKVRAAIREIKLRR